MRIVTLGVVLCGLSAAAFSQTITGSITGTVADPSGAVIPNAKIAATSLGTNLTYSTLSNSAGVYNILFLPIGQYNLTVEVAGFKKVVQGPFTLEGNQVARIDPKMEVGQITQSVEVGAVAPILQTETTQSGRCDQRGKCEFASAARAQLYDAGPADARLGDAFRH